MQVKGDTALQATPHLTSQAGTSASIDVMQKILVRINNQPAEHMVQQARNMHVHLYTHGIRISGLPHLDLKHAQWSKLESVEKTENMKKVLQQFLENPPTVKQDAHRSDQTDTAQSTTTTPIPTRSIVPDPSIPFRFVSDKYTCRLASIQ